MKTLLPPDWTYHFEGSERLKSLCVSGGWIEINWIDGTVGVLDRNDAVVLANLLHEFINDTEQR